MGLTASAAFADPPKPPACPDTYKDLTAEQRAGEYTCYCSVAGGQVFGTGIYTADSWICDAAIHVGLVPENNGHTGVVTVKSAPGCPTYAGSFAHGVDAKAWGKYEASFYFPAKGDGKCVETELPKAGMKNAALEKLVLEAYKRDYTDKPLMVILDGWVEDFETDAFGQVTGRDMSATVVVKLADGTCSLHGELWMQYGHPNAFSGPLHARGAGSASDTVINCDKVEAAAKAAPAKAATKTPAKKK